MHAHTDDKWVAPSHTNRIQTRSIHHLKRPRTMFAGHDFNTNHRTPRNFFRWSWQSKNFAAVGLLRAPGFDGCVGDIVEMRISATVRNGAIATKRVCLIELIYVGYTSSRATRSSSRTKLRRRDVGGSGNADGIAGYNWGSQWIT